MNPLDTLVVHRESRFEWERIIRRIQFPGRGGRPVAVKCVAMILASYADADGSRVFPGTDNLAADAQVSRSTVKRIMAHLRQLGLVELVRRGGGRGGRGRAAEYALSIPEDLLDRLDLRPPNTGIEVSPQSEAPQHEPPPELSPQTPTGAMTSGNTVTGAVRELSPQSESAPTSPEPAHHRPATQATITRPHLKLITNTAKPQVNTTPPPTLKVIHNPTPTCGQQPPTPPHPPVDNSIEGSIPEPPITTPPPK